jgi:pimeloyl-ACP methyl ester carboxylesterase
MSERTHKLVDVNGTRIHVVEEGEGPLVIMVHGFPELWYSWRHQLTALAAAGYRAVAIDKRGYGQSTKYWDPDEYRIHKVVGDLTGLVTALGEKTAVVIGHDWGAPVAWTAAWLHPEVFTGVIGLSCPFAGRGIIALPGNPFGEREPDDIHRFLSGPDKDFYQVYFGTLGPIIDEIESDVRGWLRDLYWGVGGDAFVAAGFSLEGQDRVKLVRNGALCIPFGGLIRDGFPSPDKMPSWMTEENLDVYVEAFERSGFGGPLSYYRNIQNNWHDLAPMQDKPLVVPAAFLGGEHDVGTWWGLEAIERAPEVIPNWLGSQILEGSGHWLQVERTEETNAFILDFLRKVN